MPSLPKFLTDENVSHRVVEFLRRIIISHDRDFGALAIARGEPCHGILYLRLRDQRAVNAVRTLDRLLQKGIDLGQHAIFVVSESGVRIRDLG